MAKWRNGDQKQAFYYALKAIDLDPTHIVAVETMASYLWQTQRISEAEEWLKKALLIAKTHSPESVEKLKLTLRLLQKQQHLQN